MKISEQNILSESSHLSVLGGWRGISILLVLAAHLLPLGPKNWQINDAAAAVGMALFFTLSGFLITRMLLNNQSISEFYAKRILRIVPLAWIALIFALLLIDAPAEKYFSHLLFYANLPEIQLTSATSHFWSLCVEMQFYVAIGVLVHLFGRRGLILLPLFCILVTAYRIWYGSYIDIVTTRRVDEILAGCTLALIYSNVFGENIKNIIGRPPIFIYFLLLIFASHPSGGWLNYLRPYLAASLVGVSLLKKDCILNNFLNSKYLAYIAKISFALYVIHGVARDTWLGSGEKYIKYLKRPLLFLVTFVLAHLSTFHFENKFIKFGHKLR